MKHSLGRGHLSAMSREQSLRQPPAAVAEGQPLGSDTTAPSPGMGRKGSQGHRVPPPPGTVLGCSELSSLSWDQPCGKTSNLPKANLRFAFWKANKQTKNKQNPTTGSNQNLSGSIRALQLFQKPPSTAESCQYNQPSSSGKGIERAQGPRAAGN